MPSIPNLMFDNLILILTHNSIYDWKMDEQISRLNVVEF